MPLSEDDINRITRSVVERLAGSASPVPLRRESPADSAEQSVQAARRPLPDPDESGPTPMMTAATTHPGDPVAQSENPDVERRDPNQNRVILATFGRNRPGVVAALSAVLAENNCDVADITQKILQEFFSMIMIVDISNCPIDFAALRERLREVESRLGVTIVAQHEDVFRAMHRV